MKKITILGHLFREMDIVAHVEISIDSQLTRIPNCSFHLESPIFFYHSAPLLLPCPSIFPQIGYSHKDFLTFFHHSLHQYLFLPIFIYLFIYFVFVIPFLIEKKKFSNCTNNNDFYPGWMILWSWRIFELCYFTV